MIEVSIRKLGAARSTPVMATKATMLKLVMSLALIGGALGLPTLYKKRARHPAGDAEHDEKPFAHSTHKQVEDATSARTSRELWGEVCRTFALSGCPCIATTARASRSTASAPRTIKVHAPTPGWNSIHAVLSPLEN